MFKVNKLFLSLTLTLIGRTWGELTEAVEIALEYIELSLLFIFKYQGKYSSRMLAGEGNYIEKELPWVKQNQ